MVKPLAGRRKPAPEPPRESWLSKKAPTLLIGGVVVLAAVLVGAIGHHFFIGQGQMRDKTSSGRSGFFQSLGKSIFSNKLSLDVTSEEMDALGITTDSRRVFAGMKAEDQREKRRLYALQKYEGGRQQADQRRQMILDEQMKRNTEAGKALKDAIGDLLEADNLGIMRIEGMLTAEMAKGGARQENMDTLIFAFQMLGDAYTKKNMKGKARDAYLNYYRLMKERAPVEQEPEWKGAMSEFEKLDPTSLGN